MARSIQQASEEALLVEHDAPYPAQQRLGARGHCRSLGNFGEHRKARFYTLTEAGRKQLVNESTR